MLTGALAVLLCGLCGSPAAAQTPAQWQNDWARGAVFYEIFVRSFQDSDGDGIGDLPGLVSRLDYLNDGDPATTGDLGVDGIWLMPIFPSPSYHGYDVADYEQVNPDYGTLQDFVTLCDEAHRRGIRVILDLVVNHTSSQHPWFVDSASSASAPMRDWYVWRASNPGWTPPWGGTAPVWHPSGGAWYYGLFWSGMPDLNILEPAVRREIEDIADFWLGLGADGFRLDAARYLVETGPGAGQQDQPETHAFWKEFSAHVRAVRPDAILVGENWTDSATIATYIGATDQVTAGDELPLNFNFPLAGSILSSLQTGQGGDIAGVLADMQALYPPGSMDAPFLTNHDQVRLSTQLGRDERKLRMAASILLTLPGTPFLYYGEELGLRNGKTSGDEAKRAPMPWTRAKKNGGFTTGVPWYKLAPGRKKTNVEKQTVRSDSLLSHYRKLIRLRSSSPALRAGGVVPLTPPWISSAVVAWLRTDGNETVLVAHNLGTGPANAGPFDLDATAFDDLISGGAVPAPWGSPGAWNLTIPPGATGIWRLR